MSAVPAGPVQPRLLTTRVSAAPAVSSVSTALVRAGPSEQRQLSSYADRDGAVAGATGPLALALATGVMTTNLRADELWAPVAGPSDLHARRKFPTDSQHTIAGSLQSEAMDASAFETQFHSFNARGFAADPSGQGGIISNASAPPPRAPRRDGAPAPAAPFTWTPALGVGASVGKLPVGMTLKVQKRARESGGDVVADPDSWKGPWAGYDGEIEGRIAPLERGTLTEAQKKLRVEQGYNEDRPGKAPKDGATAGTSGPVISSGGTSAAPRRGGGAEDSSDITVIPGAFDGPGGIAAAAAAAAAAAGGDPAAAAAASAAPTLTAGGGGGGKGGHRAAGGSAAAAKSGTAALIAEGKKHMYAGGGTDGEHDGDGAGRAGEGGDGDDAEGATGDAPSASSSRTIFHGKEEVDYQGRSWIEAPKGMRADGGDHECFLPKKPLQKLMGHNKGVQSIQFFPGTGHLLLSGSLDSKVKIWDVVSAGRPVKRTYLGHEGAVRQVNFSSDGHRFLSCSYDRSVKMWDTESGKALLSVNHGKVPYCATWCPTDNGVFLVGSANRRIMQYDARSGDVVLEYNYHLGAVNTVTFVDEGRRIVSTGDDKKVLVWDYNAPVPIKYITDPTMAAIPAIAVHPDGESFVGQSMDNQLVTYFCGERGVSQNRKKTFKGHVVSGFACQPCFSADGRSVASGDAEGGLWMWDWKSGKLLKKMSKVHEGGPSIAVAWHPLWPSVVATAGWDNMIKLWD